MYAGSTPGGDKEVGRGTGIRAGRRANTEEQAEGNRHRGVGPRTGHTEGQAERHRGRNSGTHRARQRSIRRD